MRREKELDIWGEKRERGDRAVGVKGEDRKQRLKSGDIQVASVNESMNSFT